MIERLPNESAKAYAALVIYAEMGTDRSTAKVAQALGKSIALMNRWSAQHRWVERARAYDAHLAELAQQRAAEQYLADLEEHRDRYRQTGRDLHTVARALLARLAVLIQQDDFAPSVSNLHAIVRAFEAAGNLEAHSLCLDRLLPMLDIVEDRPYNQSQPQYPQPSEHVNQWDEDGKLVGHIPK
jgi:hypothetical protein